MTDHPTAAVAAIAAVSLPPDPQAPGRARRFLAGTCPPTSDPSLCDIGQLLVSELVTNAVVHAASAVEVEVEWQAGGLVVRVRDADTGPLVGRAGGGSELDEGGRGFMLVDRLADMWGTEHNAGRKTVWFRLQREGTDPSADGQTALPVQASRVPRPVVDARRLRSLVLSPPVEGALTFEEQADELLARIADAVGGVGAALTFTGENKPIASCGELGA